MFRACSTPKSESELKKYIDGETLKFQKISPLLTLSGKMMTVILSIIATLST